MSFRVALDKITETFRETSTTAAARFSGRLYRGCNLLLDSNSGISRSASDQAALAMATGCRSPATTTRDGSCGGRSDDRDLLRERFDGRRSTRGLRPAGASGCPKTYRSWAMTTRSWHAITHPPLSSLVLLTDEIGRRAAELLIDLALHGKRGQPMVVKFNGPVVGRSTIGQPSARAASRPRLRRRLAARAGNKIHILYRCEQSMFAPQQTARPRSEARNRASVSPWRSPR
jgi:hypothetical protein